MDRLTLDQMVTLLPPYPKRGERSRPPHMFIHVHAMHASGGGVSRYMFHASHMMGGWVEIKRHEMFF